MPASSPAARVLIVDDDPSVRELVTFTLASEGHDVRAFETTDNPDQNPLSLPDSRRTSATEAIEWFRNVPPMVLIIGSGLLIVAVVIAFVAR